MPIRPIIAIIVGALLVAIAAFVGGRSTSGDMAAEMDRAARAIITKQGAAGVTARFTSNSGWPSRHPLLSGGENLDESARARLAEAIGSIPGVGGVFWADGSIVAENSTVPLTPMHCQEDVEALLQARTVRFEESSSDLAFGSSDLLDEVAAALRPCLGSIIAIVGHTDSSGSEAINLKLSQSRASTVEQALIDRGIPRDGMRAQGVGSQQPVEGLAPADPANRRIEFSVIATVPLAPTPVDTPGAR